jgi:hypothetical protein
MVQTIQRLKPTIAEAWVLIRAAKRIKLFNEEVPCPRCGKPLILEEYGTSYDVTCSDEECISAGGRGI